MKRILITIILTSLTICSCHRVEHKNILVYSDLQDSLECFIKQAYPIDFPEKIPTLFYVLFYNDKATNDTIALFIKGLATFPTHENQRLIGAGDVGGHICEIVYDGFEHLPGIVIEDNLTLKPGDYGKYGYNEKVFEKEDEYEDWYFRSGQHKKKEKRVYRINRPQLLERIN